MKVGNLMSRQAYTCQPDDSINVAAQLMWDHDCGCIPVVDEQRNVAGIITDRDIAMAAYTQGKPLAAIRTAEVMSPSVFPINRGDEVREAEALMVAHRVRRLPVVDDQSRLVGVISLADIGRAARRKRGNGEPAVTADEVARTLAEICEPRSHKSARGGDGAAASSA